MAGVAAITAAIYPWILDGFHWSVTPRVGSDSGRGISIGSTVLASLLLLAAFAVPLINLMIASGFPRAVNMTTAQIRARRFALFAFTVPTAYVFFGVLT